MEQNGITTDDTTSGQQEGQGGLVLDGESWKNKDSTTYTSILDLYGATDLFSAEHTRLYEQKYMEEQELQMELQEYVFSGMMPEKEGDEALIEYLFSDGVSLSKVKDYSAQKENYTLCLILAAVLAGLVFGIIMARYNTKRRKRRESFATEINMENIRTE